MQCRGYGGTGRDGHGTVRLMVSQGDLSLLGVAVRLHRRDVLQGVDLHFGRGVTALVGRNGAGKTSLMRVITGVLRPDAGTVERGGRDIFADGQAMTAHRMGLGWLPQEPGFPGRMTVGGLVTYAAWLKRVPAGQTRPAVDVALGNVDLVELRGRRLGRLSGGQRRRAALAAALVGEPGLLLLDEPTSGLDPMQRERLLGRVRLFAADRTVVIATHLLEDVAMVADRWCALEAGRVVGSGSIDRSSPGSTAECVEAVRTAVTAGGAPE